MSKLTTDRATPSPWIQDRSVLLSKGPGQANHRPVELPVAVAKPAHMVDERILKTCRIVGRLKWRIRECTDRLWRRTALRFPGRGSRRCLFDRVSLTCPGRWLCWRNVISDWRRLQPTDDRIKGRPQLLPEFSGHVVFDTAGLSDLSPVEMTVQDWWPFAANDQAGQVRADIFQHPLRGYQCNTHLAKFRNFSLKMT